MEHDVEALETESVDVPGCWKQYISGGSRGNLQSINK